MIEIRELDLNEIRPNRETMDTPLGGTNITIIGKRGSGKSKLIKHLLYSKQHIIPTGLVFSGSEDSNGFYADIFPDLFIYNKYEKSVLENLIKRQKSAKKHLPNSWTVLVMDDCMDDIKIFNDPVMMNLFKNGRHFNILAIFANQYVFDFKPAIRTNIDGVFIFREPNFANRDKIYKNFASIIPSMSIFNSMMDQLTEDHTCIYINNQNQSNKWTDCVSYFRADPNLPSFKFGCKDYIEYAEKRKCEEFDF